LPPCPETGYKHNCFGTTALPNFGMYVGEFRNDKPNGAGMFTHSHGKKYVGEFLNGKYHA